jgi:hypothetical protein
MQASPLCCAPNSATHCGGDFYFPHNPAKPEPRRAQPYRRRQKENSSRKGSETQRIRKENFFARLGGFAFLRESFCLRPWAFFATIQLVTD